MSYFERSAIEETKNCQSMKCKVSQVEGEEKIKQQNVKAATLSFYPYGNLAFEKFKIISARH